MEMDLSRGVPCLSVFQGGQKGHRNNGPSLSISKQRFTSYMIPCAEFQTWLWKNLFKDYLPIPFQPVGHGYLVKLFKIGGRLKPVAQ
jgi:hypothetical protein